MLSNLHRFIMLLLVVLTINTCEAQTIQDLLALETKITEAKLNDELNKLKPPPVAPKLPELTERAPKKIKIQPRTMAVYGVAPDLIAQVDLDGTGNLHQIRKGSWLNGGEVTRVTKEGVFVISRSKKQTIEMLYPLLSIGL